MVEYANSPCEICGKQITTFPAARALHMKRFHPDQTEVAAAESKVSEVPSPKTKEEIATVEDAALRDLMEKALAAQTRYLKAPNLAVSEQTSDEMMELRRIYLPESLGVKPSKHCYFGLSTEMNRLVNRGYMPVLDEKRKPVNFNELTMFWIPVEIAKAREAATQQASRARLMSRTNKLESDKNAVGGDAVSTQGITIEDVSISNETLDTTGGHD